MDRVPDNESMHRPGGMVETRGIEPSRSVFCSGLAREITNASGIEPTSAACRHGVEREISRHAPGGRMETSGIKPIRFVFSHGVAWEIPNASAIEPVRVVFSHGVAREISRWRKPPEPVPDCTRAPAGAMEIPGDRSPDVEEVVGPNAPPGLRILRYCMPGGLRPGPYAQG